LVGIFLQTPKWSQVFIVFVIAYQLHLDINMWLTLGPSVASYTYYNSSLLAKTIKGFNKKESYR